MPTWGRITLKWYESEGSLGVLRRPGLQYAYPMANVISLNTTDHPALTQLLVMTPSGLFDFKAQQAAGSVNLASDQQRKAIILALKSPTNGKAWLTET